MPRQTARRYVQLFRAVAEQSLTVADIAKAGQIGALKAVSEKARQADDAAADAAADAEQAADVPDTAARYTLIHGLSGMQLQTCN